MAKRERQVRERTRELFDALPIGQEIDWVDQVSIPLTIAMLAIVLDFPWDERMSLRKWSDMASNVTPEIMNEEYSAKFFAEMGLMLARFDALLEARRLQEPADDLLSRMIHSEAMGNLTPIERIANIALLIVGGNDTTRNSMSGFIDAFNRFPGELDRIRSNRELIPNAAQEIIRWQSPVTHMRRTCTRDVELGGQMLRAGEKVVLWYISANRDEQVFADPDRFDAGRDNARRHLGFGHGIHRCVGARLAEIQLGTVLEELADRNLTVTPLRAPSRLGSPFLHGFTAMPVRVEQA
jgi:cytochrome P450